MWTKIKIREIRKDALLSLYKDYNGRISKSKLTVWIFFYFVPLIVGIVLLYFGIFIKREIANYSITGISIFAGLFFNLLLAVADKMNTRKQLIKDEVDEPTKNYVIRYKHFSEQLISQISFTIIISIWLIFLMFLIHLEGTNLNIHLSILKPALCIIKYIINLLIYFSGCQFITMLFVILSSMYVMLLDDIKLRR